MEVVAQGDDPLIGAKIVQEASRASVPPPTERLTVGGLPAARTRLRGRTDTREVTALLAWIAYKGRIYQIAGVTPLERSEAFGLGLVQTGFEDGGHSGEPELAEGGIDFDEIHEQSPVLRSMRAR